MADGETKSVNVTPWLGHVIQAVIILGWLSAWAIVGYQTIEKQIDAQVSQIELMKQRATADEAATADLRDSLRTAISETRTQLGRISDQIADLRALVAGQDAHRR